MSWFMAGAAVVSAGTSYIGTQNQKANAIKQANAVSRAEGEAIVRERTNMTVRNAYSTALSQMQLGLEKRKLAQQSADISAATLAAKGNADVAAASTGSIGASVDAVQSDIMQKSGAALQMTQDQAEMAMINYNESLDAMVLNAEQSAPTVRKNEYIGPSDGEILGASLLSGASQFASSYFMKQAQLGLGSKPQVPSSAGGSGLSLGQNVQTRYGGF